MKSKIIEKLNNYLNREDNETQTSKAYRQLKTQLEYFEEFIKGRGVPDLVGMINQMITVKNPNVTLSVYPYHRSFGDYLVLSDGKNEPLFVIGSGGLHGLEVNCGDPRNDKSSPSIYIHSSGYNNNSEHLAKNGAEIKAYNISKEIANTVIKDFEKVQGDNRNDILLRFAASKDIVKCYTDNHEVNCYKKRLKENDTIDLGIDENAVWVLEKPGDVISVFGNANGFHQNTSNITLTVRVERPGEKFKFPRLKK